MNESDAPTTTNSRVDEQTMAEPPALSEPTKAGSSNVWLLGVAGATALAAGVISLVLIRRQRRIGDAFWRGRRWPTAQTGRCSLATVTFTRITVDPNRMGGVPCVRDLRFPVATVVAMVADGMTVDEILGEHPDLEAEDVAESLHDAALAVRERELPLRQPS